MKTTTKQGSLEGYLLDWILPALFALLISATIRFHSLAPMPTMARTVGDLLAIAALGLFILMARGRRVVVARDVAALLLALAVSATVSVLGSGGIDYSWQRLELYLAMVLLGSALYVAYRDHAGLPVAAFLMSIALSHLPFLFAAILWIRESAPHFFVDSYRLAHFANVRQYAEFAFFAATGASGAGLLSRKLYLPAMLLAIAGVFGLIVTGSRGATLSWVFCMVLATSFSATRVRAAVHAVLVLSVAAGLVWYLDHSGILPSPNIFARVASEQAGHETFDNSRLALWRMSWHQVLVHPWFGSGPEGYWLSGCCNTRIMQAHNFVLQFLIEFGVVGCGIALVVLGRVVAGLGGPAAAVATALGTPANRVLSCMVAAFLLYSLIDQTMYHLVPLLLIAVTSGLLAAGMMQARAGRMAAAAPEGGREAA
jgi:O-antigen ligase